MILTEISPLILDKITSLGTVRVAKKLCFWRQLVKDQEYLALARTCYVSDRLSMQLHANTLDILQMQHTLFLRYRREVGDGKDLHI